MRLLLILLVLISFSCFNLRAASIKAYTVDYPPFQVLHSQHARTGFSIELMELAASLSDLDLVYVDMPWARAQRVVEKEPGSLIFTLAKTPERAQRYLWIDNIYQVNDGLYALASRQDIQINSIDDVYNYSIALPVGDASLQKLGIFPHHDELLFMVNSQDHAINMLLLGRADLNHNNDVGFYTAIDKMKLPRKMFKAVYITSQSEMGVATSRQTDPKLVKTLRVALKALRQNGQYARLQQKWFGNSVIAH